MSEEKTIHSYRGLRVWQESIKLVIAVYQLTKTFPKEEQYGLVSQMRRCAVSIPSNIAEGRFRGTRKDFIQFLRISYGSGAELETQLEIAKRLSFGKEEDIAYAEDLLLPVMKMLNRMLSQLKTPR